MEETGHIKMERKRKTRKKREKTKKKLGYFRCHLFGLGAPQPKNNKKRKNRAHIGGKEA